MWLDTDRPSPPPVRHHQAISRYVRKRRIVAEIREPRTTGGRSTYRDLLLATDRNGRSWNYLASEDDYQFVVHWRMQDLIVPVVGDLGGVHALAAIADLLMQRGDHLSAFYVSNVETWLSVRRQVAPQFVKNVQRLPRDARSVIIQATVFASISASEVESANEFVAANRRVMPPLLKRAAAETRSSRRAPLTGFVEAPLCIA